MNLEGAGVIKAIADKLHEDAVAATNMGDAARSSYLSSLSLIWRDLPVTVIDAEARQRYRETGMPQKSLPADLSLSLIADDRLAIVDDMPGMWAHELQGRVVRVAPYAVNASYTPEQLQAECGGPGVPGYLARLTRDFSSVLNARGRVWPLPGYIAASRPYRRDTRYADTTARRFTRRAQMPYTGTDCADGRSREPGPRPVGQLRHGTGGGGGGSTTGDVTAARRPCTHCVRPIVTQK